MDWSPIVNEEEEFELESSDYSEWDLVTQSSKQEGEGDTTRSDCTKLFSQTQLGAMQPNLYYISTSQIISVAARKES